MIVTRREDGWSIGLERNKEATLLLAVQETPIGNRVMATTDPKIDRVTNAISAIELLRFAEVMLGDEVGEAQLNARGVIYFPQPESQHLSGLLYAATREIRTNGVRITDADEQLFHMEGQIEAFFGMDD